MLDVAASHRVRVRCIWLDTPLAQAQINLVERLLDRFGALPSPEELKSMARAEPGLLSPTQQMRAFRELEPPAEDEGFAAVERVPFVRAPREGADAGASSSPPPQSSAHCSPTSIRPRRTSSSTGGRTVTPADLDPLVDAVARDVTGPVEGALCPHPGGAPICWCRPPLPGLPLAFARRHGIEPSRSILVGSSSAHRTLANALGARYVQV